MSAAIEIRVPDIGDFTDIPVVEVLVKAGERVDAEQSLVTLESDKAVMEIPAPRAGVVRSVDVAVNDKVSQGSLVAVLDADDAPGPAEGAAQAPESGHSRAPGAQAGAAGADVPAAGGHDFDVLVLGAGPGGYTAAFRAADLGLRVALVERHARLGGVCLNVGCIPSKALLHAAAVIDEAAAMAAKGVVFGPPAIELEKLRGWKEAIVERLTGGLASMARQRGVTVIRGHGVFSGAHEMTLEAADGRRVVSFARAVIAAGSRAHKLPGLPWDDPRVMDSTGALELREVPARLLVIGGGIIGLEMACIYMALGSRVTVAELTGQLLPGADPDLVRPLWKKLDSGAAGVFVNTRVTSVAAGADGLQVAFEGPDAPERSVFDRILVSTGRLPNGRSIGAEAAGVDVTEDGYIPVDGQMRTNVAHIFAIGDIVGQPMLAHKATHEAKVAAEVCAGLKRAFEARVIPAVAYTDPELAWAGLTETAARERGIDYRIGKFPWAASGRAMGMGRTEGFTKLLFDPDTRRVIGAGMVGPHAGDLIAECVLAIEMGCEAADIGLSIHPHPTLSETIAMSAEAFEGTITDLYLPKRK